MRTILLIFFILLLILQNLNCFGQWDSIFFQQHASKCYGGNNGAITGYYKTFEPHGKSLYSELYKLGFNEEKIHESSIKNHSGHINYRNLGPGDYKLVITQTSLFDTSFFHITIIWPIIYEPGCDVNIDHLILNTDAESEDFLTLEAQIDGSFCNFGYEKDLGLIINDVEYSVGSSLKDSTYSDHVIYIPVYDYAVPGDDISIYIDNSNSYSNSIPSPVCRNYSTTVTMECDLSIDSLKVEYIPGTFIVKGKLSTRYLKLINNSRFSRYASNFFNLQVFDTSDTYITSTQVRDTSGVFTIHMSENSVNNTEDYYFKWKLGNCFYELPFNIRNLTTQSTKPVHNNFTSIFPNPVNDLLHIERSTDIENSDFTITDQYGKTVMMGKLSSQTSIIDLKNYPDGIYFLSIRDESNRKHKIVKASK